MIFAKFVVMCAAAIEWSLFGHSLKSKDNLNAFGSACFGILFSVSATFG